MIVLVLTGVPAGLRGELTRWLMEVAPGVFVGNVGARVRDQLWELVADQLGNGRALLVMRARNEQGMALRTLGHDWKPTDFDGVILLMRPASHGSQRLPPGADAQPPVGWSVAARRRRFGSGSERQLRPK